jgi:TrmH family RNA methyltransferase
MEYISPSETSQNILAVLKQTKWSPHEVLRNGKYFIGLYEIRDPGNLGTIIRSCKAFACGGVILIGDCVELYNPKVVRSSAGYILSMPVVHVKSMQDYFEFLDENKILSIVLSCDGESSFNIPQNENKYSYLFGGEASGFQSLFEQYSLKKYKIPMEPYVESLNLSISASIVLADVYRAEHMRCSNSI